MPACAGMTGGGKLRVNGIHATAPRPAEGSALLRWGTTHHHHPKPAVEVEEIVWIAAAAGGRAGPYVHGDLRKP